MWANDLYHIPFDRRSEREENYNKEQLWGVCS